MRLDMDNIDFLFNLQKGIVKELYAKGLFTEEQIQIAIKEFEQVYERNIIEEEVKKNEESGGVL